MASARTLSATGDHQSMEVSKSAHIFRLSLNELVAVWTEPTSPYVRRAMSTDGGSTWTRQDPTGIAFNGASAVAKAYFGAAYTTNRPLLFMCTDGGNNIYGFNMLPDDSGGGANSQMFKMAWNGTYWTDTIADYTWTLRSFGFNAGVHASGEARFDGVKNAIHVAFHANKATSGTITYLYLIAFSTSLVKITEVAYDTGNNYTNQVALKVSTDATPKVYVARTDTVGLNSVLLRPYTFDGTAYTLASAEETAVSSGTARVAGLVLSIDNTGLLDIIWSESATGTLTGTLKTRKRTAVNTYGATTTLVAIGLPGYQIPSTYLGSNHELSVTEIGMGASDLWVFYKYTGTYLNGELYQIRRTNNTWRTAALVSGASNAGRNLCTPLQQVTGSGADGYLHFLYAIGDATGSPWSVVYDRIAFGMPGTPTNVTPADNAQTSATPTITAKYVQNKTGDNLGKYRVEVQRVSDSTVFWDTGTVAYGGTPVAPGGTFSIVYAGTALVKGTAYKVRVTFTDADEAYDSQPSAFSTFSWNDVPSAAVMTTAADSTNGATRLSATVVAPTGTQLEPATLTFYRRLSAVGSVAAGAWSAIKSALTVTKATLSGFSAYRQLPAIPDVGSVHGWNLFKDGGAITDDGWSAVGGTWSNVVDALSPTGRAWRVIATAAGQYRYKDHTVEPGKPFSLAAQIRSDGTGTALIQVDWLDAGGNFISSVQSAAQTGTSYAEATIVNSISPGNARTARVYTYITNGAGTAYFSAIRVKQQATAPLAWTQADQQVLGNKGLAVYEATTNALTNGDFESALTGTMAAHTEPFTDANAFVQEFGAAPAVAANVLTLPAGARISFGPVTNEWTDLADTGVITTCTRVPFQWQTGAQSIFLARFIDANNYWYLSADGASFLLQKRVAGGAEVNVGSTAAALTNGNVYWFIVKAIGTTVTVYIYTDSAGNPNTQVATLTGTISDSALTYGRMALQSNGASTAFGAIGGTARSMIVQMPGVPGYSVVVNAGGPSFFVSKKTWYSGSMSGGIYAPATATNADGRWRQNPTYGNGLAYMASVRVKTQSVTVGAGGVGVRLVTLVPAETDSVPKTGTNDWSIMTCAANGTGVAGQVLCQLLGTGTVWWDLLGVEQKAYVTLNVSDGQEYTTGTRPASSNTESLPDGFNIADFGRTIPVRLDHAYNAHSTVDRWLWCDYIDASNYIGLLVNASDGSLRFRKVRAGVTSEATDAAATALAAGDAAVIAVRHSSTVGLEFQVAKNGGAAVTYSSATAEAKTPLSGTPTRYLGRFGTAGNEPDATIGIDRHLKPGVTAAQGTTSVQNPYAQQDESYESMVYRFDGAPPFAELHYTDRLIALGTSYDYRADTTAASATPTVTTGASLAASTTWSPATKWWIKSETDSTLDTQIDVVDQFSFRQPRVTQVFEPIAANRKQVIRATTPYGDEGRLRLLFTTAAEQTSKLAALRALQATNTALLLQDPFGSLRRIALVDEIEYDLHETVLEATLSYVEVT